MNNKEKAEEIADFLYFKLSHIDYNTLKRKLLEMAEWKDTQIKAEKQALIDKACEWLRNVTYFDYGARMFDYGTFIKDFKKAMEEQNV